MAMAQNSQNWEDIDNLPGFPSVAGEKEKNPVPKIAYECQSSTVSWAATQSYANKSRRQKHHAKSGQCLHRNTVRPCSLANLY
jgi:hypothetical protein